MVDSHRQPGEIGFTIQNRQRAVRLDTPWLRRFARKVFPECLRHSDDGRYALRQVDEIAVAIVTDRKIAEVHVQYMQIPGATDVITFETGDVVVSAETARARAGELRHRTEEELALYIVHALLHLNGFDDTSPRAAARMRKVQDRLWREGLAQLPPPQET
jgi:probable rRNA maturation factor